MAAIDRAHEQDPGNVRLALAELQLKAARGDVAEAQSAIERLPIELANDPEVIALRGQLRFASALEGAPSEPELVRTLSADPNDSRARYQLAAHQVVRGDYEPALENLLTLMKRDRGFEEDAGRKGMLAVFDLLGGGDLVASYRAKMMNALY